MKMNAELIDKQLRDLIHKSCCPENNRENKFSKFHCKFLKLHFEAMDVDIDYDQQSIFVWSPKPIEAESFSIQNIFKSITKKIEYDDLEATLCGCLKKNELYLRFYHLFLLEYGDDEYRMAANSSLPVLE